MRDQTLNHGSIGRKNFIRDHDLWNSGQIAASEAMLARIADDRIERVRVLYSDQHGVLRGKELVAESFVRNLYNGCGTTPAPLSMDSSSQIVFPIFAPDGGLGLPELGGGADMLIIPDPVSFAVLPWQPSTASVMGDLYLRSGEPMPFSTRHVYRQALKRLGDAGYGHVVGLEIEFHVFKIVDGDLPLEQCTRPPHPPQVTAVTPGYRMQTSGSLAAMAPVFDLLQNQLKALGIPLRSFEDEYGPGQIEITTEPLSGLDAADQFVQIRSAVKQICRQHGYLATFMSKPLLPNVIPAGWHIHQSLLSVDGRENVFAEGDEPISPTGRSFIAGLLEHATAMCAFANPTVNAYKRLIDNPLAPNPIVWALENKAAMIRVSGPPGSDATHLECRIAEPAANPYLCLAAQVYAGLDGICRDLDPGPPCADPASASDALRLPSDLGAALDALSDSQVMREYFGDRFVDYFLKLKRFEYDRFRAAVTDWEHREYFEGF